MAYEFFYQGGYSSLKPSYGDIFTGYRANAGSLGATTSVQTANQVREVTNLLNQGIKNVEVSTINAEVFDMIPKQHLKEINRLSQLTGASASLHAPIIDPSGFTQQGWDPTNRVEAEKQFINIVERAHELNPKGNIPVTIHSSIVPGTEHGLENGKEVVKKMIAVNRESGELIPLIREKRFYPENVAKGEEKLYEPEEELKIANSSYWDQKLSQLLFYKERGDELIRNNEPLVREVMTDVEKGKVDPKYLTPTQKDAVNSLSNAGVYMQQTYQSVNSLFNQAWKFSDAEGKDELKKVSKEFEKQMDTYGETKNIKYFSDALQSLINKMKQTTRENTPEIYRPVEEFVKEKASETLGNVAFSSYEKFKESSPIISIENPPYGQAVSRAKDMKELIEASREQFVKKAKAEGMDEAQAEKAAEKIIGATWDTSHIAMMRKSGFKNDQLVKEAGTIAPFVKHVHFNDNLGGSHTDLPAGMGDTPMKAVMGKIDQANGGNFKGAKIFEGGNFFQHFQTSPHPYVLEGVGSPVYTTGSQLYWNQIRNTYGSYFGGFGTMLPEQHFSMYGGGFSGLPSELGGQVTSNRSRSTGTPME